MFLLVKPTSVIICHNTISSPQMFSETGKKKKKIQGLNTFIVINWVNTCNNNIQNYLIIKTHVCVSVFVHTHTYIHIYMNIWNIILTSIGPFPKGGNCSDLLICHTKKLWNYEDVKRVKTRKKPNAKLNMFFYCYSVRALVLVTTVNGCICSGWIYIYM